MPNIIFYLIRDNLIFDYATQYCLQHPVIAPVKDFVLTDADYDAFKAMVKKANFQYDQQSEKILKTLREAAEFEGYLTDASEELEALQKKLTHNIDKDLDYFAPDIKEIIANEIVKRYYFQQGAIIEQLKNDEGLREALKVLTNPTLYQQVLSAEQKAVSAK